MTRTLALLAASSLLGGCGACSSGTAPSTGSVDESSAGSGGGASGGVRGSGGAAGSGVSGSGGGGGGAGGTAGSGGSDNHGCAPPTPSQVPTGWIPLTDYSCDFPLYVPESEEFLPEPIEWESCGDLSPERTVCQRMKITWPYEGTATSADYSVMDVAPADGKPKILFGRASGRHKPTASTVVVAEVDGPVLFGAMVTHSHTDGLRVLLKGLEDGRAGIVMQGDQLGVPVNEAETQGLWVVEPGTLHPALFTKRERVYGLGWNVGRDYIGRIDALAGTIELLPNGGGDAILFYDQKSDPDSLQAGAVTLSGSAAFTNLSNSGMTGIMAYDPVLGAHPLRRWFGDTERGAYAFGTDGVDMVWTDGSDYSSSDHTYMTKSIMTAKFTTDPDKLEPRRVRSEPAYGVVYDYKVGCGYAAHEAGKYKIQITRLSDGTAWMITGDADGLQVALPMGVTCDDFFFGADYRDAKGDIASNVFRVRLDSLGEGIPPD